ncbi:MAG: hypothetical protein ACOYMF_05730 [Bacteroidales bacterium]
MNTIYVIQDHTGYAVSASFSEGKAREICKGGEGYSFREVPIHNPEGWDVVIVAPAIPQQYLPNSPGPTQSGTRTTPKKTK